MCVRRRISSVPTLKVRHRLLSSSGSWFTGVDLQTGDIDVPFDAGAESVATGIEQFEAFAEVGQPDARSAAVVVLFGVVAVFDAAGDDAGGFYVQGDVNVGGGGGTDAVFEGVFDQSDEQQRRDERAFRPGGKGDL